MDNMNELNLNEMEEVTGGAGGSREHLPDKKGFKVYQIQPHDTLTKIAGKFNTTVDYLMEINRAYITNKNDITAGFWIYVPKQK